MVVIGYYYPLLKRKESTVKDRKKMNVFRKVSILKPRLIQQIKRQHLTMRKVAKAIGVPYETLRQCVSKQKIMPDTLDKICRLLDVSPDYLMGEENIIAGDPNTIAECNLDNEGVTKEDLEDAAQWYRSRIDSEGFLIPTYDHYDIEKRYNTSTELLLDYLTIPGNKLFLGKDRAYFQEHIEEIQEIVTLTVHSYLVKKSLEEE